MTEIDELQADSGRELLDALAEARRRSDPDGRSPAFDRVVLAGNWLARNFLDPEVAREVRRVLVEHAAPPAVAPSAPARR